MNSPIATLQTLRESLRPDAPAPIVAAVEAVLAGEADSLDKMLGLRTHGGISPLRSIALSRRNELMRRLWRLSPEWKSQTPAIASRLMALSARRYETDRWPRERNALSAPSAESAATWWRILRAHGSIPGAKRIQQILEAEIQDPV